MCLVETGMRDKETGKISMMPRVVPACQTPANDGTVFITSYHPSQQNTNTGRLTRAMWYGPIREARRRLDREE